MAGLGPAPPGIDLSATQVPRLQGVNIATFILAVIAIVLRFTARRLVRQSYWWDDWLMLPAIVAASIMVFVPNIYGVNHGLGRHVWAGPQDVLTAWAKGVFITEICYPFLLCCVKFSLLAFYWPLLKNSDFRKPTYVLAAIIGAWGIATILIAIFQCRPVNACWTRYTPDTYPDSHKCFININHYFSGTSIPNIITDAALLVLPLPQIWGLNLPKTQKLAVIFIVVLGIFVLGVSITRFTFIISLDSLSPDVTWNFVNTQIWTAVESHTCITCACLPTLLPFLNLILFGSVHRNSRPDRVSSSSYSRFGKPHDWEGQTQATSGVDEGDSIEMLGHGGVDGVGLANRSSNRSSDPPRIHAGSKRRLLSNMGGEIQVSTEIKVEGADKTGKRDYNRVEEVETYATPFPHPVMRPSGGRRYESDDNHGAIRGLDDRI